MDAKPAKYAPKIMDDVTALVTRYPFAWVVSHDGEWGATPLPLRPRFDTSGNLVAFVGHFARSNAQIARLRANPRALLLFMGPHGYISPSWMADRTQAASWNYASAAYDCTLTWIEDQAGVHDLLRDLIDTMENGHDKAWSLAEMGDRAERLSRGIIGFRAEIVGMQTAFKLGQDERDGEYHEILTALDDMGEHELAAAMRAQNTDRG